MGWRLVGARRDHRALRGDTRPAVWIRSAATRPCGRPAPRRVANRQRRRPRPGHRARARRPCRWMAAVRRRHGWVVVIVAVAALAAVWRVLPASSPPIYDGNCIADPYVTLGGSPAAKGATMTFPATTTPFPASEVFTGETPPQAQLLMEA